MLLTFYLPKINNNVYPSENWPQYYELGSTKIVIA